MFGVRSEVFEVRIDARLLLFYGTVALARRYQKSPWALYLSVLVQFFLPPRIFRCVCVDRDARSSVVFFDRQSARTKQTIPSKHYMIGGNEPRIKFHNDVTETSFFIGIYSISFL